jgi:uncharacterized alkaline shock family protein YloU
MPNRIGSAQASAKGPAIQAGAPNDVATNGAWQGKIEVSPRAIATVAGRAVAECYGVVGIAARRPRFGTVELLAPEDYRRGVEVRFTNDHIAIDVYVVLEHGLRITEIAHNIMENVKFAVERTLGLRVVRINVNVQALRVTGRA